MKLIILKDVLKKGVATVEKISQKVLTLPILQNILFETEKNFLKLSTTNLESGIIWWGLSKTEKEGQICIPTKLFSNFLNFLPQKPIKIETEEMENQIMDLECENYKTKIKGFNVEDFPIIPQIKDGEFITIKTEQFCGALAKIINIPSPSMTRPEISGIFLQFQNDLIKLVATDSFRLAEEKIFTKNNILKEYSLILPQTTAREIVSVFTEKKGDLKIYLSANQIFFEYMMEEVDHPQIQFTSRLVEGEYPNYQEIIPKKYGTRLILQKEEFLNQIKTASFFSGKINEIKMKVEPKNKKIEIFSQNPDLGEYRSELKGKVEGKELAISFNHRFLVDGINEIKTKELVLEFTGGEGAAALKPLDEEEYLYIIMPIKAS